MVNMNLPFGGMKLVITNRAGLVTLNLNIIEAPHYKDQCIRVEYTVMAHAVT